MTHTDAEKSERARAERRTKKRLPRMRVSGRGMKRFATPSRKT